MSENRRITLFLEDESEMSHQEGLDVFQIRKTKERYDYFRMCPGLTYFLNQGTLEINRFFDDSESEFFDFLKKKSFFFVFEIFD